MEPRHNHILYLKTIGQNWMLTTDFWSMYTSVGTSVSSWCLLWAEYHPVETLSVVASKTAFRALSSRCTHNTHYTVCTSAIIIIIIIITSGQRILTTSRIVGKFFPLVIWQIYWPTACGKIPTSRPVITARCRGLIRRNSTTSTRTWKLVSTTLYKIPVF